MIDSGATHNFITPRLVQELSIPADPTKDFGVTLGTRETRMGNGRHKAGKLNLGALCVCESFLPLELGHAHIISNGG